jgi:acetyl-CoA acyltransferase
MSKPVIIAYARSPFDFAEKGRLASVRPDDFTSAVIKGLLAKTPVKDSDIEDLIVGCAFPEAEQGMNIGRMLVLLAGLPKSIGGCTVNRFCGSSMQAIHIAAGAISMGMTDLSICAGVESMSRIPMGGFMLMPNPKMYEEHPSYFASMGETADNVADLYKITRKEQEEFAYASHQKAAKAQSEGKFKDEIIPIQTESSLVDTDGCIRANSTLEDMAKLRPAFREDGTVTAATSSPLTDGAAATLVCSEDYAKKHGFEILASIRSFAVHGCEPETMGLGPIFASRKALAKAGLTIDQMDIIELNEAFASQSLACIRDLNIDVNKVNLDGGAIALGHPLGATGARITGKVASLLKRENKRFALATQCIGGGQGIATILEREM